MDVEPVNVNSDFESDALRLVEHFEATVLLILFFFQMQRMIRELSASKPNCYETDIVVGAALWPESTSQQGECVRLLHHIQTRRELNLL